MQFICFILCKDLITCSYRPRESAIVVLRGGSYVNSGVVIVYSNNGLQILNQLIIKVILKVLLTKATFSYETQELRVEFLE